MNDFIDDIYSNFGDDLNYNSNKYQSRTIEKYSFKDNKDYWVTNSGEKIYPCQMSTGHIKSTIKLIEGNCKKTNYNQKIIKYIAF